MLSLSLGAGCDRGGSGDAGVPLDAEPVPSCEGAAEGTHCAGGDDTICIGGACVASRCGDGYIDGARGEECDDGNELPGDGCGPTCVLPCDTAECQAALCRTCTMAEECADGACVAYNTGAASPPRWCSQSCESDADCAGLEGFTRCGGGYCVHERIVTACATDGRSTRYVDRCDRTLAEEPCEEGDACVELADGSHACRSPSPLAMCQRCERDAQCESGRCLTYTDFPDSGFCSTQCESDADCAGYPGLTRCASGFCAHADFTEECSSAQGWQVVDSCGVTFLSGACEGQDRCEIREESVYCIATNRPECAPCETGADCAGGSCIGYAAEGIWNCSTVCTSSADCAGSPNGLTECAAGGFCVAPSAISSCSADGTQVLWVDRCGNVRPPTTCTSPQQCVVGSSGGARCTTPGSCIGTPSSCFGRTGESTCEAVRGCYWDDQCNGSAQSCYSFYGSASCRAQDGCDYEGLYPNGDCRGSATSCRSIYYESSCDRQVGCRWEYECEGTPQACSTFGDLTSCDAQPGCHWG